MNKLIYRIISFFFGPSDKATARHFAEQAKQRAEPFVNSIAQEVEAWRDLEANPSAPFKVLPESRQYGAVKQRVEARLESAKQPAGSGVLKDYEAFQTKSADHLMGEQKDQAKLSESWDKHWYTQKAEESAKPLPIPSPAKSKKQAILNYIKLRSPKGVTAESVARAFPAWTRSTVSARVSELYKSGSIVSVGLANTSGGSLASIYAVSE